MDNDRQRPNESPDPTVAQVPGARPVCGEIGCSFVIDEHQRLSVSQPYS